MEECRAAVTPVADPPAARRVARDRADVRLVHVGEDEPSMRRLQIGLPRRLPRAAVGWRLSCGPTLACLQRDPYFAVGCKEGCGRFEECAEEFAVEMDLAAWRVLGLGVRIGLGWVHKLVGES